MSLPALLMPRSVRAEGDRLPTIPLSHPPPKATQLIRERLSPAGPSRRLRRRNARAGRRLHSDTEADVDLDRNLRAGEPRHETHAHAAVLVWAPYLFAAHGCLVELNRVRSRPSSRRRPRTDAAEAPRPSPRLMRAPRGRGGSPPPRGQPGRSATELPTPSGGPPGTPSGPRPRRPFQSCAGT